MISGKVLGFGTAILDVLSEVPDEFIGKYSGGGKGGMVLVDEARSEEILGRLGKKTVAPGGSAGNTVIGLLRLGIPARMLGKVGDDSDGKLYRERFTKLGGDDSALKVSRKTRTGCCICLVTPDSERTMRTFLGAASEIAADDLTKADLDGVGLVHLEGYQLYNEGMFDRLLAEAKKRGIPVSFDLSSYEIVRAFREKIGKVLRENVDIVFANEDEAAEFVGRDGFSPEKALDVFSEFCSCSAVKLGKKGALLRSGGETVRTEARLVKAVDTTGAGDLWQAGFLYGHLTGKPLAVCGEMGSILGSEVVRVVGAGIPEERWPVIKEQFKQL